VLSGYEPTRKALIKRMVYMFFGDSVHNKRVIQGKVPWHLLLLSAVLALSAFLNLSRLTSEGYGNVYYAATVKNMLDSWYNFFFVSYDAGFVSVDKPPDRVMNPGLSRSLGEEEDTSIQSLHLPGGNPCSTRTRPHPAAASPSPTDCT
jgi:hypothetical protein